MSGFSKRTEVGVSIYKVGGELSAGLQIKSFLADKRGKYRGKKEGAATVLIKTIRYCENTKYTLKKSIKKKSTQLSCV
jgi:hypothetical protein